MRTFRPLLPPKDMDPQAARMFKEISNYLVQVNAAMGSIEAGKSPTQSSAFLPQGTEHLLNEYMFDDVLATLVTRGALVVGNSYPKWTTLAIGASATLLRSNGTDPVWTTPAAAGLVSGSGTVNYFPIWTSSSDVGDSGLRQATGKIIAASRQVEIEDVYLGGMTAQLGFVHRLGAEASALGYSAMAHDATNGTGSFGWTLFRAESNSNGAEMSLGHLSDGFVGFQTPATRPDGDNTRDYGTSGRRAKDVYVAGALKDGTNTVTVAQMRDATKLQTTAIKSALSPSNGQVLTYVTANSQWEASTPSAGVTTLDSLTDVTAPTPATGDYLRKSSGDWVNVTVSQLLTDLKTVDGAGSGLDSDFLDGISSLGFCQQSVAETVTGLWTFNGDMGAVSGYCVKILPTSFYPTSVVLKQYGILQASISTVDRDLADGGNDRILVKGFDITVKNDDSTIETAAQSWTFGSKPNMFGLYLDYRGRKQDGQAGINVVMDLDNTGTAGSPNQHGMSVALYGDNDSTDAQGGLGAARFESTNISLSGDAKGFVGFGTCSAASQTGRAIGVAGIASCRSTGISIGLYGDASGATTTNYGLYINTGTAYFAGDIQHVGSKFGAFNVTPVARPAAFTQTYATATRTHANPTATAVSTTAAGLSLFGYTTQAQADSIPVAINALIADVANIKQVLNQVIDDLQLEGWLQ